MKKIISCLFLISSVGIYALFAQDDVVKTNAPSAVRQCFQKDYPNAVAVAWEKLGHNWWYGAYKKNGQILSKSCSIDDDGAIVASFVKENSIPQDIMNKIEEKYGPETYDITKVKGANGQDQYIVRVLKDGQMKTEKIDIQLA